MRITHGETYRGVKPPSEYTTWRAMKKRCLLPTDKDYPRYGGRGIKVCKRWMKYENFVADMGRRPSPAHSLERKNNNGNYSKRNCKWGTDAEQRRNQSSNHWIEYNGLRLVQSDWAARTGLNISTIHSRLKAGWSAEKALTFPVQPRWNNNFGANV